MQREPQRQRGGVAALTFETKLENEVELLDTLLSSLARGQLPPDAWTKFHLAAVRDDRLAEVALAYENAAQSKRLKTMPPAAIAEFLFRASTFFSDAFGDELGAVSYLERALAAMPTHAPAFEKIEQLLIKSQSYKKLAEVLAGNAPHRPRGEQAGLLRRAVDLFEQEGTSDDKVVDLCQQVLRLEPQDEGTRDRLAARYLRANRHREVTRLLEQALAADPPPSEEYAIKSRTRLVELYAGHLREPERSMPHVEALLARDPSHEEARRVAAKLLEVKGLAARAASTLAAATDATGVPGDVARFLAIELEHTRGPKRRDVLRKIGLLRQDRLQDDAGAYESFEAALALDPADDELRGRYAGLAKKLGKETDAARALSRVGAAVKDPQLRSKLTAEVGQLYLSGGDPKRAKTTLVGVMAVPNLEPTVALSTARSLSAIYAAEKDYPALADVLQLIAITEPDAALRQIANEELAELAMSTLRDSTRAIGAYCRLLDTSARPRALAALEPLYEAAGDTAALATVLEERARDAGDPVEARRIAFRAAEIVTTTTQDAARAIAAWGNIVRKYGPARDVHGRLIPLLEAHRQWSELASTLDDEARLAPDAERAGILARLGAIRLQKTRESGLAIAAFQSALALDAAEKTSRTALEKLVAIGDRRLEAAAVLEPLYRAEGSTAGLLRVLDLKAELEVDVDARLAALDEAARVAQEGGSAEKSRAFSFVARGLSEAVASGRELGQWLARVERLMPKGGGDPKARATALAEALGSRVVDSQVLLDLARRTGDALAESGEVAQALEVYRRALAFEPSSSELLTRVDDLLRDQGDPLERVALYRAALDREPPKPRRRELLLKIGGIQKNDIGDKEAAIAAYRAALADDQDDREARAGLVELYSAKADWNSVSELLESFLARATGEDARRTSLQLAEVASARGDKARAAEHLSKVLSGGSLDTDDLAAIERVAEAIGNVDVQREALQQRAVKSEDPREQVVYLDKLARVEILKGDVNAAVGVWKRAAQIAEKAGDDEQARRLYEHVRGATPHDSEAALHLADLLERAEEWSALPDLYAVLLEGTELPSARVGILMRHARILAEHLDDPQSALVSAAQAFELATGNERRDVLTTFTHLALLGKGTHIFAQAMDDAVERLKGDDAESAAQRADFAMAKGRVLAANREGRDAAAAAYRTILDDARVDEARLKAALLAFESLLSSDTSEARRIDRRWLLSWKADHAPEEGQVPALVAWASAEETTFDDLPHALALYRRVLTLDPENAEVMGAVSRLSLATGDVVGAIHVLRQRRDRSEGTAKSALELEIATVLVELTDHPEEALSSVAAVLQASPQDDAALALAARLLALPATHAQAIAILEKAEGAAEDAELRSRILRYLLDTSADPPDPRELRHRWFERLLDLHWAEGHLDLALHTALSAATELPTVDSLWDRAESLARELDRPNQVAELYQLVLAQPLPRDNALALGQRAVTFHEEWFEDSAAVVRILERVLEIDSTSTWAFDRLKLLFDASERWDDLFALFDRALLTAEGDRRRGLLEDAAQIAKDFANNSDRAIAYLEQLLVLKPGDARLVASLERLYERHGSHRELIALLMAQLPSLAQDPAQRARARVALLWLDEIGDSASALAVIEEIVALPDRAGVDVFDLLERVLAAAPAHAEARDSVAPPSDRRGEHQKGDSATKGKRVSVRQRAAALLKDLYSAAGRDQELVRILEIELEPVRNAKERIRRHKQIAQLYAKLGNDAGATEHFASLVLLEPDVASHRVHLTELTGKIGRYDRLAEVLASAADECESDELRVELLMHAAEVQATSLRDSGRAIDLLLRVIALSGSAEEEAGAPSTPPRIASALALAAARKAEPLLEVAGRSWERLDVLERIADLEPDVAARSSARTTAAVLATELGENPRAIAAWEARLEEGDSPEALDGLVILLERERRWSRLLQVLDKRASSDRSEAERRIDRVHIAHIHATELSQVHEAVDAWRAVEREFGENEETMDALLALFEVAERWAELADLLARGAARAQTPGRRAELLHRLGDLQRERLAKNGDAVASYEAAVAADPHNAGARAGLRVLLNEDAWRAPAVEVLLKALAATDEWPLALELTEHRIAAATDNRARSRVLREVARVAEERGKDAPLAFHAIRRAFLEVPDDAALEAELARLAEATREWRAYADAYAQVVEHAEGERSRDPSWIARLRLTLGETLEKRLDNVQQALRVYEKAAKEAPAEAAIAKAVIRAAGTTQEWPVAAVVIVNFARVLGRANEDLFVAVESAAQGPVAWDGATRALAAAVKEGGDLPPSVARDIEARLGAWHRDRRGDPEAAEEAFGRALVHDSLNAELLGSLAQIQRRAKGRPLIDSLLRLSQATGGDLDLLREAAEIAIGSVADRALATSILESLLRLAKERWVGEGGSPEPSAGSPQPTGPLIRWVVEELTRIHADEGNPERTVELLETTSRLPFEREISRGMLHEAARLSRTRLGDVDRAIVLYSTLYEDDPHDADAVGALLELYESESRRGELLALRRRQIVNARTMDERLALRLAAARIQVTLGDIDGCVQLLEKNLGEARRHAESCAELFMVLEGNARFSEFATLLAQQAALAEEDGEAVASADLWERAAIINEEHLGEIVSAIAHHKRVVALEVRAPSLDALARLSLARGDPNSAAQFLERLVVRVEVSKKGALTLRLADALTAAGKVADARERLEAALVESPEGEAIRMRLAQIYRDAELWEPLADLLAKGGEHAPDKATHLRRLLDAASLYSVRCAKPELAIPLLERASDLEPADRSIRLALADALGAAGRFADARTLLRALVDSFAGRRPKERAPVHYHLARLELTMGDRARALVELDAATRIDPSNPLILRSLAELARDDGQFDRAERSYRALLVALKRPEDAEESAIMVRSEVLLELGGIAERQGEHDRATEILESALETASKGDVEGERLERALRARGDYPMLVRAMEARLARIGDTPLAAPLLLELAEVLDVQLGHLADAFVARLRAVALLPASPEAHESALSLARRTHGVARYVDEVDKMVLLAQDAGNVGRACDLLLRLGRVAEDELKDDKRAAELFERARSLTLGSAHELDALRALDRVYERLGDREAQARALAQRVDAESRSPDKEAAADALFRFAALRLEEWGTVGEGCERLLAALALQKDEARAVAILKTAASAHTSSERVLSLYEDIARAPGHERALIDALVRRAALPGAASEPLREAVLVAINLGDGVLAEGLLRRYIDHARAHDDGAGTGWALASLAELREAAGDLEEALRLKQEAADASEPDEARRLSFEVARIAEGALGDLALAARTYEGVLEREPADREAWEPLLNVYRRMGRTSNLVDLLAKVIDYVDDNSERSRLRLERVRILMTSEGLGDRADALLREIVDDDPTQVEAALLLAGILEKSGRDEELSDLLARQIDAAKDRSDAVSVGSLSLRLAALLEKKNAVDAKAALYAALEWVPEGRDILVELARLHDEAEETVERADVLERLLPLATGPEAERVALDLKAVRLALGDAEGANRALELGYRAFPAPGIGAELERVYRDQKAWGKLAELFVVEARSLSDAGKRVARLREAAGIHQKQLDEPARAAELLRAARAVAPHDQALLLELVDRLEEAHDLEGAASELSAAIDQPVLSTRNADDTVPVDTTFAPIYAKRAALRIELGETDAAAADLEQVFKLGGAEFASELAAQFVRLRAMAEARGDAAGDRALRLRLAEVLPLAGDLEAARALLADLVKQNAKDRDALRLLARLEEDAGHWEAVTATYRRLVTLEEGSAMVDAALHLADACERAGRFRDARGALERARLSAPENESLRARLAQLYEQTGAFKELAEMSLADANATKDVAGRFAHLIRAGALLVQHGVDPQIAVTALEEARALRPSDAECTVLLADAYTVAGRTADAVDLINQAIASHKGRRSRDLGALYHRLARVAHHAGDRANEMAWLASALDMDGQNGFVASELAEAAMELGQVEVAQRALRAITMFKGAIVSPISKALAYQHLGDIARQQGDVKRAVMFLKRAIDDDPSLASARAMLDALQAD